VSRVCGPAVLFPQFPMTLRLVSSSSREVTRAPADASLLRGLLRGERASQAEFFDLYAHAVETLLLRILGPDSELEDLMQESFLQALKSVHRYRGDAGGLWPWLRAVTVRTAYKRLRRRSVRRRLSLWPDEAFLQFPTAVDPSTQAALSRAQEVIARLPASESLVFSLRFVEGLDLKTIAESSGLSVATVKRRLARARQTFDAVARRDVLLQGWLGGEADA